MRKNFRELEAKMSPESRARAHAKAQQILQEIAVSDLRRLRRITQEHIAKLLHVDQSAVSKMERRADMYVTTLQDFVRAMGGELKIVATFPDGQEVQLEQFGGLDEEPRAMVARR